MITYPLKSQLTLHHLRIHTLTTPSTSLTRLTEVFESPLKAAVGSKDFSGLASTSDLDKYADLIVSAISTTVYKAIPKSKSVRTESSPISKETLALIKEKRRLRRQYSQIKDPAVNTRINQLQRQVKEDFRVESQASWKKILQVYQLREQSKRVLAQNQKLPQA